MTDKQIINEIDISKCEFCYSGEYCHIYSGTADFRWMCKENEDCQIKNLLLQLQAKKQECEELKNENKRLVGELANNVFDGFEELDQLKAENEELRQILWFVDFNRQSKGKNLIRIVIRIEELLKKCATGYTDELIQEMFSILYELEPVCRNNKLEQLSKTLTEIKEIAEKTLWTYPNLDDVTKYNMFDKILQKISECEGNDDRL